jgi:hypothetical protein
MEFVLSKLLLVVLGVAIIASFAGMFGGLDERTELRSAKDCVSRLAEVFNRISSSNGVAECRLVMSEMLPSKDCRLEIARGSLWLIWNDLRCPAEISQEFALVEEVNSSTMQAERLSCGYGDVLIVESHFIRDKRMLSVHIENVSTSTLIAFTNLSHSEIVL